MINLELCPESVNLDLNNAATPDTTGVDIDVPDHLAYLLLGSVDIIYVPGAVIEYSCASSGQ